LIQTVIGQNRDMVCLYSWWNVHA